MKESAMECTRFDWKAYALGELSAAETAECDRHAGSCERCRAELARWQTTVASLRSLPQAEPPRRIVFAPEPASNPPSNNAEPWWRRMWNSGPQLGFASASVLALAIVAHGLLARMPASTAPLPTAQMQALIHVEALKEVNRMLPQAMDAALKGAMDQRLREELTPALASLKQQVSQDEQLREVGLEQKRDADQKAVRYAFERLERRINYATLSSARPQGGE
jgi:anti-sigma factor RsiW